VASHETDEVLGTSSGVNQANIAPPDLFRYTSAGVRNFTTAGDNAWFAIDPAVPLVQYNQNSGGDFGDWWSTGAHTPRVQDAFGTPGATPNLGVELTVLDVVGWDLVTGPVPAPAPTITGIARSGNSINFSWSSVSTRNYQPQYKTNLAQVGWINLGSPITATGTSTSASDTFGSNTQRYYQVALLPSGAAPPAAAAFDPDKLITGPFELEKRVFSPSPFPASAPVTVKGDGITGHFQAPVALP